MQEQGFAGRLRDGRLREDGSAGVGGADESKESVEEGAVAVREEGEEREEIEGMLEEQQQASKKRTDQEWLDSCAEKSEEIPRD